MKWWYENEEEEMKLYKNEDLCIECKNEFFSKPYDHRDPTPGTIGYCIHCDNCLIKDKKMEFDKSRCYSALNADELRAGDKVIVADDLDTLKEWVKVGSNSIVCKLTEVQGENHVYRFIAEDGKAYSLAYLVERAENCTNCEELGKKGGCRGHGEIDKILCCDCYTPKTEQKAEKNCKNCIMLCGGKEGENAVCEDWKGDEPHYRPFRNTDELIKVWEKKLNQPEDYYAPYGMPLIWVRDPKRPKVNYLITGLMGNEVHWGSYIFNMQELFDNFEFLDGTPCGVEE